MLLVLLVVILMGFNNVKVLGEFNLSFFIGFWIKICVVKLNLMYEFFSVREIDLFLGVWYRWLMFFLDNVVYKMVIVGVWWSFVGFEVVIGWWLLWRILVLFESDVL